MLQTNLFNITDRRGEMSSSYRIVVNCRYNPRIGYETSLSSSSKRPQHSFSTTSPRHLTQLLSNRT